MLLAAGIPFLNYMEGIVIRQFSYIEDSSILSEIYLPKNITYIEEKAFAESSLEIIHIPRTIKRIGDHIFKKCMHLKHIYYEGTKAEWKKVINGTTNIDFTNKIIFEKY